MSGGMEPITATERISQLADDRGDEVAIVSIAPDGTEVTMTWGELATTSAQVARLLAGRGAGQGTVVVLALPNGVPWVVTCYAAWWLGACVLPVSTKAPWSEREELLAAAATSGRPMLVVDEDLRGVASSLPGEPLPRVVAQPFKAIPSGGSTGRPKLIVSDLPLLNVPGRASATDTLFGRRPGQTILVLGPLYHTGPFGSVNHALFGGGRLVLLERFDAELALRTIERHSVNWFFSVPAQLQRMARVDGIDQADLESIDAVYHSGAACPVWLKHRWIELVGAQRVIEGYGSTEGIGTLFIRGDEWLDHPGSIGCPTVSDVEIRDERGSVVPPGEIGEIHMRWRRDDDLKGSIADASCEYWGSAPAVTDHAGYLSVGDLGWMDEDGYVYIADRRVDMVVTGGVNVYPAEVEAALSEHPLVRDVVVVGVPDPEWGRRVHAVVESDADPAEIVLALDDRARARLAPPKVPKTYEVVAALPRDDNGKIRRSALSEERSDGVPAALRPGRVSPPAASPAAG